MLFSLAEWGKGRFLNHLEGKMGPLASKESIDSQKGKVQFPLTRLSVSLLQTRLSVSLLQTAGRDAYPILLLLPLSEGTLPLLPLRCVLHSLDLPTICKQDRL